ncbi:UDP-N-acetylglucosamine--N-acetylmuramyl-(pentapeptide) pyrophosphoryl-undecaprenol N-acetylglucosamine transferase [Alphaproteobacteria bacterium]|nr:UDP-N-acetylglucosamine--N-acetylmuramyl-(pentapeptide) pyrophosphoryl-undecaprenol N-acetylglucosamine transferase [Alphaproteobacteria bacterium]
MVNSIVNKKILFVTGGTGGHIFPALSTYEILKKTSSNISFATDKRGFNNKELSMFNPILINSVGFQGKNLFFKIYSLLILCGAILKALIFLKKKNIQIVLGFGSYVQVPFVAAALLLKRDVVLHEANAVIGRANKLFWKYVRIRTSAFYLGKKFHNTNIIGMPVRAKVLSLYKEEYRAPQKKDKINILILGGSLGASSLSYQLCKCITFLPYEIKKRLIVTHQVKADELALVEKSYKKANIKFIVDTFIKDISSNLRNNNLIISRSGASTLAECSIAGIPSIYFPLPSSIGNHQYLNALTFKDKNAAWIFNEEDIVSGLFLDFLKSTLVKPKVLKEASKNIRKFAKPNAGENLAKLIVGLSNANL